jgi:hypothetical protein
LDILFHAEPALQVKHEQIGKRVIVTEFFRFGHIQNGKMPDILYLCIMKTEFKRSTAQT